MKNQHYIVKPVAIVQYSIYYQYCRNNNSKQCKTNWTRSKQWKTGSFSRLITVRCAGIWPWHTCTTGGSVATPVRLSFGEQRKRGKIRSTSVKPVGAVMWPTTTGDLVNTAGKSSPTRCLVFPQRRISNLFIIY